MIDTSIKVLVVDDMSTMRRIVKNVLKQIGYTDLVESENGQDALNKLKGGGFGLVVLILDINYDTVPFLKGGQTNESLRLFPPPLPLFDRLQSMI